MSERERRETLVRQAVHGASLEGLSVSLSFREDGEMYVRGTISADELVEFTRKRFGLAGSH